MGYRAGDGKGMDVPKATSKESSVEGSAHTDVPGGESKGKTWVESEGPNPGRSGGKKKY